MLKRGDIILCHDPHSLISKLIAAVQKNRWSHVAWVVDDLRAIEALPHGVRYTPLSKFKLGNPDRCKVVRIKDTLLTPRELDRAVNVGQSMVGRHNYDYLLLFKLAWAWLWKRRHTDKLEGSRRKWICSEVIAEPLWQVARFKFNDVPSENTSPKDIATSRRVVEVDS